MRSIFYFIFFLSSALTYKSNAQDSLVTRKFLNERIQLELPDDFELRTDLQKQDSLIILTDRSQKVNISIRHSILQLDSSKITEFGQIIKSRWTNEPVVWLSDGLTTTNKKPAGFYKFIHTKDNVLYYTLFTDLDNRLLTITVTFPVNMLADWEALAEEIASSLKIDK